MSEVCKTVEIVVEEKTYVSKKINPSRKGMIIREVFSKLNSAKNSTEEESTNLMADIFEQILPKVMWAFIKDEDKQVIGTFEKFEEELEGDSALVFYQWIIEDAASINSFLAEGTKETPVNQ